MFNISADTFLHAGFDAAPDLMLCVPYLAMSSTNGLTYFLNSLSKCSVRNAFRNMIILLRLGFNNSPTRGEDDSLDKGRSLSNLSVTETGQVAL